MIKAVIDYFKGDPEKIRIAEKLLEQLDNIDDWQTSDNEYVSHKTYNITARWDKITAPEFIWIPVWQRHSIKKKIRKIQRKYEIEKLNFIYDNLDGIYALHIFGISDEQRAWLKENATEDQYIERARVIYISDDALAMGYKLQWM